MTLERLLSYSIFLSLGLVWTAPPAPAKTVKQLWKKTEILDRELPVQQSIAPATTTEVLGIPTATPPEKKQGSEWRTQLTQPLEEFSIEPPQLPGLRGDILRNRATVLNTAHHLRSGEILPSIRYRQSFPPGESEENGFTGQPTVGLSWGITDHLELTLDLQSIDTTNPKFQGDFEVIRTSPDGPSPNFLQEITLQLKQRLWESSTGTQALSLVGAISQGDAGRPMEFLQDGERVSTPENDGIIPSLELPFTVAPNERLQLTISPKVAFFPEEHALYLRRLPIEDSGSFGTTFGVAGGISYLVSPRFAVWGDLFLPISGNNTISRDSGFPEKTIAFNAGVRYLINPRLATDLFISNALGNTGALSIVADQEYVSLGLGVTFIPPVTGANREYPRHFSSLQESAFYIPDGFSALDGGTVPPNVLLTSIYGGSQGFLTSLRYGVVDDFEMGFFIDSISGAIDESESGVSLKVGFLNQAYGEPFTLSGVVTFAGTNNVMINLLNDNPNALEETGEEESVISYTNEDCDKDQCLIASVSLPMSYQYESGAAIWFTPVLGFIQRNGLQIAGFNLGGSIPLSESLDVVAETGLEFAGKGNTLTDDDRKNRIPWSLGLRWNASALIGHSPNPQNPGPQVELYLTNRVGASPFHSLRVRNENDLAIGFGLTIPIQF